MLKVRKPNRRLVINKVKALRTRNYNPSQPRDDRGRWSSGGGSGLNQESFKEGGKIQSTGEAVVVAAERIAKRWDVSQKDLEMLSKEEGVNPPWTSKEEAVRAFLYEWQGSSGFPVSVAAARAVADDLGLTYKMYEHWKVSDDYIKANPDLDRVTSGLGRAMYAETQEWLAQRGITEVRLLRSGSPASDRLISSWSTDWGGVRTESGREVVKAIVPARLILSVPSTGFGTLAESEVVVLPGERLTANVSSPRKGKKPAPNPLKSDPSRTATIRRQFEAEISRRWDKLKRAIIDLVERQDAFGLVQNTRWKFRTDQQKLQDFKDWMAKQTTDLILGDEKTTADDWWQRYVELGYRQGAARAFDDTRKPYAKGYASDESTADFYKGSKFEFLSSSFNRPASQEKVKLLGSRVYTDLKGVTDSMATRMAGVLVDGFTQGKNPKEIGRDLAKQVDVGKYRAQVIARTECLRAHSAGQLQAFRDLGVESLGVAVEFETAEDGRVCPLCSALQGIVVKVDEAEGMLPRHPQCRCVWLPSNVSEDRTGQKRSQEEIEQAIDESIDREPGKDKTPEEKRADTRWLGADQKIAEERPESILDKPEQKPPEKGILERIADAGPGLEPIRQSVVDLGARTRDEITRLEADYRAKNQRMFSLDHEYAEQWTKKESGEISQDDFDEWSRRQDALVSEADAEWKAAEKAVAKAKFNARRSLEKALDVGLKDRIEIKTRGEAPFLTLDLHGNPFKTTATTKVFKDKLAEAKHFVSLLTRGRLGVVVETAVHQGPKGMRPFHRSGDESSKGIFISDGVSTQTFCHEIGHRLEDAIPGVREAANQFLDARIKRAGKPDVKMKSVCKDCGYADDEVGNEDDWKRAFGKNAAYVGKRYSHGRTEVISMGLEELYADPVNFARNDPEYFNFIVGVLRGVI